MIVTGHIKFGLHSNFLDSMLQAEDERLQGESIEDGAIRVYKDLEKAVAMLKQEAESMRGQIIEETIQGTKRDSPPIGTPIPQRFVEEIPTINREHDRLRDEIDDCQTIEELVLWKGNHDVLPGKILTYYTERLKILSNGQ